MEFTEKRKKITIRAVVWITAIAAWYIILLVFGLFSVVRSALLTAFGVKYIIKDIRELKNPEFEYTVKKDIGRTLATMVAVAAIAMFTSYPFLSVWGVSKYQYVFSKMYVNEFSAYSRELLPEKLPDEISDYYFEFFPGFMQGGSRLRLDFTTDSNGIAEVREYAEGKSVAVLDLEMYRNDKENEQVTAFKKSYFKPDESGYINDYFEPLLGRAYEEEGSGEIYIFESNGNWNHPYTVCVTINYDKSIVSFDY